MSAKISAARRSTFLKALGETGNVTLSAERAKVSRAWAVAQRKAEPEFDEACKAALAAFARPGMGDSNRPPSGWGYLDGAELVVRGSNKRRVQIARARVHQWSPRVEDRFLAALAATCNVRAACAEAGMSVASAYEHRERWPAFAERWDEAVRIGYMRLEDALFANAANLFSTPKLPTEVAMPPMTVDQLIHIMHMHKNEVRGIGRRPGRWRRPRRLDEVHDSILGKLEAIARGRRISAADKARDRREWERRRPSAQSGGKSP